MVGVDIFDYRIIKSANGTIVVEVSNFVRKNNIFCHICTMYITKFSKSAVKLGNKERFDKEQIAIRDPLWITNPFIP